MLLFNSRGQNLQIFCQKENKGCATQWPCHFYIVKILNAKEELWKLKYLTMQKYNLQKKIL